MNLIRNCFFFFLLRHLKRKLFDDVHDTYKSAWRMSWCASPRNSWKHMNMNVHGTLFQKRCNMKTCIKYIYLFFSSSKSIGTFWREKENMHIFHIYFHIATFLKKGWHLYIHIYMCMCVCVFYYIYIYISFHRREK